MTEINQGMFPFSIQKFQDQAWPVFRSDGGCMVSRRERPCSHVLILRAYLSSPSRLAVCHGL